MLSHKEFIDDAIENSKSLPLEMNDLYKRYFIDIPLDYSMPAEYLVSGDEWIDSISSDVAAKTNLKFDAIVTGTYAKSMNDSITIIKAGDVDPKLLEGKLFKNKDDKLAAYSNASSRYFLKISAKAGKSHSVNILFINRGQLSVQVLVDAEAKSKLGLFELYVSDSDKKGLVTVLHEVSAAVGSDVEISALHNENANSNVINLYKASISDNTKFKANFAYSGGMLTKAKGVIDSSGVESNVEVNEVAYGTGEQRFDLSNLISNTKPRSYAKLESGTVLDGKSQCMLKGFAKVEKGTKGCFSRITERGILLSGDAHVDALPDMSIDYSNEVKATHSAATSPIDQEALFYLESRGLEESQARRIFITAFLSKYISNMGNGAAHEVAMSVMLEKLDKGTFGVMPFVTPKGVWMTNR